jgi:hypothetical protein
MEIVSPARAVFGVSKTTGELTMRIVRVAIASPAAVE